MEQSVAIKLGTKYAENFMVKSQEGLTYLSVGRLLFLAAMCLKGISRLFCLPCSHCSYASMWRACFGLIVVVVVVVVAAYADSVMLLLGSAQILHQHVWGRV